jgi:hypothetical protein
VTRFVLSNPGNRDDPTQLAYFTMQEHGAGRDNHIAAPPPRASAGMPFGNGLDGIRLEAPTTDALLVANRIRNNGRRCAPAASGGGRTVTYTETTLVDEAASWPEEGHRGKPVRGR